MSAAPAEVILTGADDPAAFDAALIVAMPKLKVFARSLAKSADRAEDLLQETLCRALKARHQFRLGTNMSAWLSLVMRNHFYSEARRNWRQVDCFDDASRDLRAIDSPAAQFDLKELEEALSYLPAEMREAIAAVVVDGLSYEEAAEELNTETGTIKSRVSRGRRVLDAYFGNDQRD